MGSHGVHQENGAQIFPVPRSHRPLGSYCLPRVLPGGTVALSLGLTCNCTLSLSLHHFFSSSSIWNFFSFSNQMATTSFNLLDLNSLQVSLQDETTAIVPKAGPSALKFVRCRSSLFFHGFSPDLPRCLYGYLMQ